MAFNEHGELEAGFDITNLVIFPNGSSARVKVGWLDPRAPPGQEFAINEDRFEWHFAFRQVGNLHCLYHLGMTLKLGRIFKGL